MPRLYVAPTQKRNVLTPVRRQGKGWTTGQLEARYATAIRNVVLVLMGRLVYAPSFGSHATARRGQGTGRQSRDVLEVQLRRAIGRWVSDVVVLGVNVTVHHGEQRQTIDVVWGVGESVAQSGAQPAFAIGPVKTSITV